MRAELVEAAVALAKLQFNHATRIGVSRGATPALMVSLGPHFTTVEAAVVRGRTVWETAGDVAGYVVETPNWFGLAEPLPSSSVVLIQTHAGVAAPSGMWRVACDGRTLAPDDPAVGGTTHDDEQRTRLATLLAKSIRQIAGAQLAHRMPRVPWFVALLPVDPGRVVELVDSSVVCASTIDRSEFPGGIRLSVGEGAQRDAIREYAAALETAVVRVRGGG